MLLSRWFALALVVAAGLAVAGSDMAEARMGGGKSFGSRGSRTYNAPPATNTAPNAAPVARSMAPKAGPSAAQNGPANAMSATQPSRFGGMRGLLMGGLFVAALGGIFGFGALASVLGFVLQIALVAAVVYLVVGFFRNRNRPAMAHAPAGGAGARQQPNVFQRKANAAGGGGAAAASTVTIGQTDLNEFERLLGEIQAAYSREDAEELGVRTTPEMLSYLLQEISDNAKQGLRNEVSNVKLLQGDVAEAWREDGSDYATVAIRYALTDVTFDRASGKVVSGDANKPTEVTELWTFRRDDRTRSEGWQLSAVQQTA
jgi:predicted lipid-binding transport protein (Tim44 family)